MGNAMFCRLMGCAVVTVGLVGSSAGAQSRGEVLKPLPRDPKIAEAIAKIDPAMIKADIAKLVTFGTRNTLSSMDTDLPEGQGVLAAAAWIESEFQGISAKCGGCLEVKRDEYVEPVAKGPSGRVPRPTKVVNIYAIFKGTAESKDAPWMLVTGHYDSRATDVMDSHVTAPGANDDASGVAVSLESARALTKLKLTGTIVFVAVAGEEQGLIGSRHLAQRAKAEGWPLEGVLDDDIVGGDTTPGETMEDKGVVRVFSENVPATATAEQEKQMLTLGAENDSPSRELARTVAEIAPTYFAKMANGKAFHPVLILRRDRYLRGGDHTAFNNEGFTAVRFTEWRENFDHQHNTVRVEDGKQFGDLLKYVDFEYVAKVARLNAATLATLADAPSVPQNVRVLTAALDNYTELTWEPSAYAPAGTTYEVVWRPTNELLWTNAQSAGTATTLKLNVSKDNVLFGVRAVDAAGHRSLPVPPVPARGK